MTIRIAICMVLSLLVLVWMGQRANLAHAKLRNRTAIEQNPAPLRTTKSAKPSPGIKWRRSRPGAVSQGTAGR